jgi:hypothetical protein
VVDYFRAELATAAIAMATANHPLASVCVFYFDRGSNRTSYDFARVLGVIALTQSPGRTGICSDNAGAASRLVTCESDPEYGNVRYCALHRAVL